MVKKLTERNTITIPKGILEKVGSEPGDYFEISEKNGRIVLTPKIVEDKFTEQEWGKLAKITKEKGKVYKTANAAKKHLEGL